MLTVDEAQQRMFALVNMLGVERAPLADCLGRVLREPVAAVSDAPAFDNSAMDGYAVRAGDAHEGAVLRVIGEVAAGAMPGVKVEQGTAVRIMTGAAIPDGADSVIQVEWTDGGTDEVRIQRGAKAGANIRRRGEDAKRGATLIHEGVSIGPAEIALLASSRRREVMIGRRPRVAILSTGDELADLDEPLRPGTIVNTNGPLLESLVRHYGGVAWNLGIVRDNLDATMDALRRAGDADLILSSGGVSVGAYDYVKAALEKLGAQTSFWRVAMKPGKPLVVATLGEALFIGLPGNPASCFVAFHLFAGPAIRRMMGQHAVLPLQVQARATASMKSAGDRRLYTRVRLVSRDGELLAEPLASQSSGSLMSMRGANGLAVVDRDVTAGETVNVLLI
jgi:molybdopterin molybdotransferase